MMVKQNCPFYITRSKCFSTAKKCDCDFPPLSLLVNIKHIHKDKQKGDTKKQIVNKNIIMRSAFNNRPKTLLLVAKLLPQSKCTHIHVLANL